MEKSIILGGNEYKYKINFKMSYDFLKYRNRITKGFDFSKADKKVVQEIVEMQEKIEKKRAEKGEEVTENDLSFVNELSPEALAFLQENQRTNYDLFSQEEILEIISVFTGIKEEDKIMEILDVEISESGFDTFITKIIAAISEVFTSAKDSSQQKEINKAELQKVINK